MDTIARLEQRINKAEKDLAADKATLSAKKAAERKKTARENRKRDTRRKIIIGAVVLADVLDPKTKADTAFRGEVLRRVGRQIKDRDLSVVAEALPDVVRFFVGEPPEDPVKKDDYGTDDPGSTVEPLQVEA